MSRLSVPRRAGRARAALAGIAALALAWPGAVRADSGELPGVVGEFRTVTVAAGDTLVDLAYAHRVGFEALARLNPQIRVWIPEAGQEVWLPTRAVLPDAPPHGLVVNVAEMRLYDFGVRPGPELFAIAVGDAADATPLGEFRVGAKLEHPHWRVPASIRAKRPELPAIVPPGPDNPLGSRWLTVGNSSYGIHGTDLPWSIGRLATHGCIRLYDDEVQRLYARVAPGTPIRIVYQSVKLGRDGQTLYLEVHPDRYARDGERAAALRERLDRLTFASPPDLERVQRELAAARGIPVPIGELADPPVLVADR